MYFQQERTILFRFMSCSNVSVSLIKFFAFSIILSWFSQIPAVKANHEDSLSAVLKEEFNPQTSNQLMLGLMIQTSRQMRITEPDKAIAYCMEIYRTALKLNETFYAGSALYEIGKIYSDKLMYFTSLEYSLKGYQLLMDSKQFTRGGYFLIGIGNCYFHLGHYQMAYGQYIKAYEIFESTSNFHGQAVAYNNIGLIKEELFQYDSAIFYFEKALDLRKQTYLPANLGHSYYYLGKVAVDQGDLNKARHYFDKAIPLLKSPVTDVSLQRDFYSTLGLLYFDYGRINDMEKKHQQAITLYQSSVHVLDSIHDRITIAKVYIEMGTSYTLFGRSDAAIHYFRKALALSDSLMDLKTSQECYKKMIAYFMSYRQTDSVFYYHTRFTMITDSLQHMMMRSKFNEIQQALKITEIENEATILKQKNLNYKLLTYSGILIVSFILIGILFYIIKLHQHKKQYAREINSRIEAEKEGEQLLQELQELNLSKDRFISIMAHDLRSPFNALMGFSDLLVDEISETEKPEQKKYALIIQQIARNSFQLLENLLTWSRLQLSRISIQPVIIDLFHEVSLVINIHAAGASKKSVQIHNTVGGNTTVFADLNMVQTILRNLLSNAIKYTPTGGRIEISAEAQDDMTIIRIRDNGIGVNPEIARLLFRDDEFITTKGTDNEGGSGLGLLLCKQMVEKNGGKIWIESTSAQGSIFAFSLPAFPSESEG